MKIKSTTLLVIILTVGLFGCVKIEPCDTLPKGYLIVTDGEKYRWRNSRITSGFDRDSKEEAIAAACRFQKTSSQDSRAENWPEAQ
jgi:hypothetical protein